MITALSIVFWLICAACFVIAPIAFVVWVVTGAVISILSLLTKLLR